RTIQKHWVLSNHLLQDVPNNGLLPLNHFSRLFDRGRVSLLFKLVVDERLEQLERHLFRETALMQFQFGTNDDHRTARVVDAFAKQVLAESTLFSFKRS